MSEGTIEANKVNPTMVRRVNPNAQKKLFIIHRYAGIYAVARIASTESLYLVSPA